jgi:hypothetical protein
MEQRAGDAQSACGVACVQWEIVEPEPSEDGTGREAVAGEEAVWQAADLEKRSQLGSVLPVMTACLFCCPGPSEWRALHGYQDGVKKPYFVRAK